MTMRCLRSCRTPGTRKWYSLWDAIEQRRLAEVAACEAAEEEECCEEELEVEADEAEASIPNNNADASEQISFVERLKKNFSVEVTN